MLRVEGPFDAFGTISLYRGGRMFRKVVICPCSGSRDRAGEQSSSSWGFLLSRLALPPHREPALTFRYMWLPSQVLPLSGWEVLETGGVWVPVLDMAFPEKACKQTPFCPLSLLKGYVQTLHFLYWVALCWSLWGSCIWSWQCDGIFLLKALCSGAERAPSGRQQRRL